MHILSSPFPTDGLRAEYDVIAAITKIVTALPCALHWKHVTGHQDEVIPQDQLTRMDKLNIHADAQVTLGLGISSPQRTSYFITPSIAELRVNSTTITSHYAMQLRQAAGSEDFCKWYISKYKWTTEMINLVDWDAHLAAIRKLGCGEKRFITKFDFHWLPTGHQQHKVDPSQSTLCPSCQDPSIAETETHLYQCLQRIHLVGKLFNQLQQFHTCPALQNTLKDALKFEIFGQPRGSPHTTTTQNSPSYARNRRDSAGANFSGAVFHASGPQSNKVSSTPSWWTAVISRVTNGSAS
jgi:hypothetical protein